MNQTILTIGILYCVVLVGLVYGLPLLMPRYRAQSDRRHLASQSFGAGAPNGDTALTFFGGLLIIIVGNLMAWAAGLWS